MSALDDRLILAHEAQDGRALVDLYTEAAQLAEEEDARAFYLTHAFVFALEQGAPQVAQLRQQLIEMGRETPV
ncbi:hypothetical protein ROLI_022700 [Roseobacter fucihabitans]|uniref:Uncharacterized protein n=1 Tax=Roseobacter fucihabitans TaxID=1537242 RepID=A0ABZ2BTZ3_9RHOB|nr:hypothetical protein [Roseobacter litoralis]MBC6967461.1 hypothetical protein [Roseobacter litoralis]